VKVTFLRDRSGAALHTRELTLPALRDLILSTTAGAKEALPWLKLARFGDKRSDKGSLRHDANVLKITGVELDYDGKLMPFEEAVAITEKAGLNALLYTSPSTLQQHRSGASCSRQPASWRRRSARSSRSESTVCSTAASRPKASRCRKVIFSGASMAIPSTGP
jgi:hypothetical protein